VSFGATFVPADVQKQVLAHAVPVVPQTLEERFDWRQERRAGSRARAWSEDADTRDAPRLLGLGGDRRDEEAASQRAEEFASVHHSIT
jgi:hypothetical protein